MKTTLLSLKAFFTICLLCLVGGVNASAQETVTFSDVLTPKNFAATENQYKTFKTNVASGTIYEGETANGNQAIQLNGSKLGIYTTRSGGYARKVILEWNSNTSNSRTVAIYGKEEAYKTTEKADAGKLLSKSKAYQKTDGNRTETIEIKGNYQYIGINSSNTRALYLNSITIIWEKVGTFPLTTAQYGTYYTEDAYVMPEGVLGYTITSEDGKTLKFNETYAAGAVVPAKTALVLKATEELTANKEYTYTIVNSTAVAPTNNLLHGSVAEAMTSVEGATAYYKLAQGEDGLGFYYGAENGGEFKNGAHKAYLAVMTKAMSQMRGFSFDSMTTGINHVVANAEHAKSTVIYDLNGRRVNSLNAAAKGVYIVNGKKVIVK